MTTHYIDRPMAAHGLTSYRCAGRYGWIMIGATDNADALREARRSWSGATMAVLQIWNGERYVPVTESSEAQREESTS